MEVIVKKGLYDVFQTGVEVLQLEHPVVEFRGHSLQQAVHAFSFLARIFLLTGTAPDSDVGQVELKHD